MNWEPRKKILLGLITVNFFIYIVLTALGGYAITDYNTDILPTVTESNLKTCMKGLKYNFRLKSSHLTF